MKKSVIIISGAITILAVVLAALVGIFFLNGQEESTSYRSYLEQGQKYLAELQYDDAIAAFEYAIEENSGGEDAYAGLYETYIAMNDLSMASNTLQRGLDATGSERLRVLLNQFVVKYGDISAPEAGEKTDPEETLLQALSKSEDVSLDVAVLQKFSTYDHKDYIREFGSVSQNNRQGKTVQVQYRKLGASVFYEDVSNEPASLDEGSGLPQDDARPVYLQLDNIGLIFRDFDKAVSYDRLCKLLGIAIVKEKDNEDRNVIRFPYKGCEIRIETDENGNIISKTPWNRITPPRPAAREETEKVVYQGSVVDAVTGNGLSDATVSFIPDDNTYDTVTAKTDQLGSFEAELEADQHYQMEISKEGYITERGEVDITAEPGETMTGDPTAVSPELAQGEIRIVLTWGATPSDLDSHLSGTTADGEEINVSYITPSASVGDVLAAELDVDDTSSYGPETTTIYVNGTYEFSVHNYSGGSEGVLSESEAQVKVYMSGQNTPQTFTVPAGAGYWWRVFRIENGRIVPVNEIS